MTSEHEAVVGGRMAAAIRFHFEWMSFSGRMRLDGAEELLPPGTTFFGALASDAERARVRAALEEAAREGGQVSLSCRLAARGGPRSYLLTGAAVRGERTLAPRVEGVLVEQPEPDPLEGVVRRLAGTLDEGDGGDGGPLGCRGAPGPEVEA
jgi:hypothetical protein